MLIGGRNNAAAVAAFFLSLLESRGRLNFRSSLHLSPAMHKRPSPRSQFRHACRHTAAAALAVVALVAAPTATAAQNRIALVVGNADYLTAPLKNPQNDARDIAEKLNQVGFDVVLRENLKIRDIGGALREFRARLSPGDEALFFYAGHGLQVKGINYLPAVDAEIKTEEDLPFQSLNVNQVLEIMDDARPGSPLPDRTCAAPDARSHCPLPPGGRDPLDATLSRHR